MTAAARKFDIEVWLPSEGAYREATSCSNYRDFSARRLRTNAAASAANCSATARNCSGRLSVTGLSQHRPARSH